VGNRCGNCLVELHRYTQLRDSTSSCNNARISSSSTDVLYSFKVLKIKLTGDEVMNSYFNSYFFSHHAGIFGLAARFIAVKFN
jgi:hypothetical protein